MVSEREVHNMRDSDARTKPPGSRSERLKRPPVGIDSYPAIRTRHYAYVDKTLLVRDVIDRFGQALLFARPRKFGKTLNLSMLRTFFEDTGEDPAPFFEDTLISGCGDAYMRHMGRHPVICLDFTEAAKGNWDRALASLIYLTQLEYGRIIGRMDLRMLDGACLARIDEIRGGKNLGMESFQYALGDLAEIVHHYYGTPPVILLDEYDAVMAKGAVANYGDAAAAFMGAFLSPVVRPNPHVAVTCLFGVQRPPRSCVKDLASIKVFDTLSTRLSEYFGFTPEEVRGLAVYYNFEESFDEIERWYNGYRFGTRQIYNPLSVLDYFQHGNIPNDYWVRACAEGLLTRVLEMADSTVAEDVTRVVLGAPIKSPLSPVGVYGGVGSPAESVMSLLYTHGYLTRAVRSGRDESCSTDELVIPNKELRGAYVKEMMGSLDSRLRTSYRLLDRALRKGRPEELLDAFRSVIHDTLSTQEPGHDSSYRDLIVGLTAKMHQDYILTSAVGSGGGYQICLHPRWEGLPGALIEAQRVRDGSQSLGELANAAVERLAGSKGEAALGKRNVQEILEFGVGYDDDHVEVATREVSREN